MATMDKSQLPKVGEVWLEAQTAPNRPHDELYLHGFEARLVKAIETHDRGTSRDVFINYQVVTTIGNDRDGRASLADWASFTKRAVRVDDKERGR